MESQLWAIAVRGDASERQLKTDISQFATVSTFRIPKDGAQALRIGTLDSLMSLSDDLVKMDVLAEATVTKMYKQLSDLSPQDEPSILGVPIVSYTTMQWEWDMAKFQTKTPLRELSEGISMRLSAIDDELKVKVTEVNGLKGSLQGIERKTQGNLMVRGLADVINEQDVMESDYMTTLFVVVPKASLKDFESTYEKMAQFVVPKSGKLIMEDAEYGLFTVIIFKKSLDEFKANAREKRYSLRDFTYDPTALESDRSKKATEEKEYSRLTGMLAKWCHINYAECYGMMLHLKAVRVFTESVLRYGLSTMYGQMGTVPNFKAFLLQPKKGKSEQLRKALAALYGDGATGGDGEEEMVVPGAQGEFYPYVYTLIETEPNIQT